MLQILRIFSNSRYYQCFITFEIFLYTEIKVERILHIIKKIWCYFLENKYFKACIYMILIDWDSEELKYNLKEKELYHINSCATSISLVEITLRKGVFLRFNSEPEISAITNTKSAAPYCRRPVPWREGFP